MKPFPSTAYSRDLGDELRRLRETCTGMSGTALAVSLGWDQSKVSNIEHGKAHASEIDLVQILTACGKDIDYFNDFRERYKYAFDEYVVQVSDNLRTLALAESTATTITSYDTQAIPGLIQTEEYADGLYRQGGYIAEERIPTVVRFRMERQAILRRHDRPTCMFYIHEHALDQQVGSDEIMADQYGRLLFTKHVIRIVPASSGLVASSCVLWEYEKAMPVAFTSTDLAKVFVQDPAAIARTRILFDRLDAMALDAEQSRRMLAKYVGEPRKGPDDSGPRMA